MSACAGGQALAGLLLFAGTLVLDLHAGGHAHAVSLVSEGGHLHLVLSHEDAPSDVGNGEPPLEVVASFSEGDHVLHLESDGLVDATTRRAEPAPSAALVPAVEVAAPRATSFVRHRPPRPGGLGTERLRTTVLRL